MLLAALIVIGCIAVLVVPICLGEWLHRRAKKKGEELYPDEKPCEACSAKGMIPGVFFPVECPMCQGKRFFKREPQEENDDKEKDE